MMLEKIMFLMGMLHSKDGEPLTQNPKAYRRAPAGIEKPLVMKSDCFL